MAIESVVAVIWELCLEYNIVASCLVTRCVLYIYCGVAGESEDPTGLCMGRVGDSEFAATQIAVLEFPLARNVLCLNEMDESAVLQHRGLYFFVVCSV